VRARFDVRLMNTENGFRFGGVYFVKAALWANGLMQHRSHRAIGDENRVFEPLVEIKNFQCVRILLG